MMFEVPPATLGHPVLDRPIWAALASRQSHLALTSGGARMFDPAFSHFGCEGPIGHEDVEGFTRLAHRVNDGLTVMQADPINDRAGLACSVRTMGLQMVWTGSKLPDNSARLSLVLDSKDTTEMQELVAFTEPGPFRPATHRLGTYLGIRRGGRLVAMAGERLKPSGYSEISAVCVHPEFRGQSLARMLVSELVRSILARNEVPFLHLYATNTPALNLYKSMGFEQRRRVHIISFTKAEARMPGPLPKAEPESHPKATDHL
ncbi:MAG: GNAT family N-acetyltransferase [Pseudomonadota bacterium]